MGKVALTLPRNLQGFRQDLWLFGRKKGSGESIWDIKKQLGDKYPEDFGEMNPKTAKKARRHASPLVLAPRFGDMRLCVLCRARW